MGWRLPRRSDRPSVTPGAASLSMLATSVVSCENLLTVRQSHIRRRLGTLPPELMQEVDDALSMSLGLR